MARAVTTRRKTINTVLAWSIGILIFFPILWTILTSFKTEAQAINDPPIFLFFDWTLENYAVVQERSDYMRFLWNSVIIAGGSTLIRGDDCIPAAWSMAFVPSKRTKDILLWMLSTKMLPAVGVLYPIYLIFIQFGLLDSRIGLVVVIMLINLPIIVWMLYTYFKEIPGEILEAARMDGASLREEILYVLTPMACRASPPPFAELHPGLERSVLDAQPDGCASGAADGVHRQLLEPRRPVLRQAQRGLDHGHRADPHPGWFSQKQLVRGLTFGAVK
jgi:sorbitol/mannitol transport system permease protein